MDDLLDDHYKEQDRLLEKQNKKAKTKAKAKKNERSYDDEDRKEALLTRIVENCHNQA